MTSAIEELEIAQTWKKLVNTAKNAGYREGAADGRETVFQKSFDEGYTEGFKIAFILGKYKGVLRASSCEAEPRLDNSKAGLCEICKNKNLLESTIGEVQQIQTNISNNVLSSLYSKHSSNCNVELSNKLK